MENKPEITTEEEFHELLNSYKKEVKKVINLKGFSWLDYNEWKKKYGG